ncbi:MAG: hypothetical protein CMN30_25595 [Sandaracinus sp.]|nr:hypothetical protein [Sandaracinus sp.]
MDVTPILTLRTAPQVVFDQLAERADQPRFMLPEPDGSWTPVTWQQYADGIREIALALRGMMAKGDRACIFAANRVEWSQAALGIQAMGGVMVPIYGSSTDEQARYVVDHAAAKVLFVDGVELLDRVLTGVIQAPSLTRVVLFSDDLDPVARAAALRERGLTVPTDAELQETFVTLSALRAAGAAKHHEAPAAFETLLASLDHDDPTLMLYTSGTSGPPKGVPLTHRNIGVNGLDWLENNAPVLELEQVDLLWLPMSHIFGYGEVGAGNQLGWVTYMSDPRSVMDDLPRVKPQVFMSVPSVWEKLAAWASEADDPGARLRELTGGRLEFCLSGGAGLKREVKERFHAEGFLIIEGYGLTECSPTLTLNRPGDFRFDTVGKPLPSVELKLAADGEILAKGDSIFRGYHEDPEATARAFDADGFFMTGDIGRFTEDGFLQIIDRKKDILVTAGGKNVAPANIELRFNDDPFLAHVVVFGDAQKYLVAGVWLADPTGLDGAEGRVQQSVDRVNGQLARHETIKKFRIMDEPLTVENGMLTATLKVRRKKVYERFGDQLTTLYDR